MSPIETLVAIGFSCDQFFTSQINHHKQDRSNGKHLMRGPLRVSKAIDFFFLALSCQNTILPLLSEPRRFWLPTIQARAKGFIVGEQLLGVDSLPIPPYSHCKIFLALNSVLKTACACSLHLYQNHPEKTRVIRFSFNFLSMIAILSIKNSFVW